MNAYLIDDGAASGLHKFRCSNCGDNIRVDHSPDKLRFCWHCSMHFGPKPKPEPKKEPTPGDWWYDTSNSKIYSHPACGLVADVNGNLKHIKADGYLMAASKKLLAACRRLVLEPYGDAARSEASAAIAEAEKGMQ